MKIIEYSIKNRIVIVFATLILSVAGIFSYFKLGKLEDPEFKVKEAIVITLYPGASPESVEQEVTDKIEIALRKIPNADVDSISKAGYSEVHIKIDESTPSEEVDQQWDIVRKKITDVRAVLPLGALPSVILDDYGDVYGMFFAITSEGFSRDELYDYVKDIRKELEKTSGVAKTTLFGNRDAVIEVLVVSRIQMGKTQKDLVGIHFHGQTNWTEEENYTFNSMIKILNIQLREALREDKGGVYGVGVNGGFSQRPKNAYGINIQFNTEPKRVDELIKTVYENIDSLKNNLVSEEKIIKVKETQRREREMDLKENDFWLNVLQYYDEYGKDIQLLFDYDKQIDGLTAQKIKDAFKKYFDISNHVEVVLEPEK